MTHRHRKHHNANAQSQFQQLVKELGTVHSELHQLAVLVRKHNVPRGHTRPAITVVREDSSTMKTFPAHSTFSNMKTQLNTISTLPDGNPDPDAIVTVESSDAAQVGIEQNPDGGYFITTPADQGSATITIKTSSPNATYEDAQFDYTYVPPPAGQTVPVIGSDVPDA